MAAQTKDRLITLEKANLRFLFRYLQGWYLDCRSLAVFRMGLGATIVTDLFFRMQHLTAHYSDEGVLSRLSLLMVRQFSWYFSLNFINGTPWFQRVVFLTAVLLAICFLIGLHTRLVAFLLWIFILSIQSRNPFLSEGYDVYVRDLLFWCQFIPLNSAWSVDKWRGRVSPSHSVTLGMGSLALIVQILCVYFFSGIHKMETPSWQNGEALAHILGSSSILSRPLGNQLANWHTLMRVANDGTLLTEIGLPFLFLLAPGSAACRIAFFGVFALLHLLIWICINVDLLPPLSFVALVSLLPSQVWQNKTVVSFTDAIERKLSPRLTWLVKIIYEFKTTFSPLFTKILPGSLAGLALVLILWFNVLGVFKKDAFKNLPDFLAKFALVTRINQNWPLFVGAADENPEQWITVGTYQDGQRNNLFTGEAFQNSADYRGDHVYSSHRWARFFVMAPSALSVIWHEYGKFFCKKEPESKNHGSLQSVELWHVISHQLNSGTATSLSKQGRVAEFSCHR